MNPLKVLHVMPQIGTGGAERQLYELIIHSDPAKVRHQVFYYSDAKDEQMLNMYRAGNIDLVCVPRHKNHPVRFLREFVRMIRKEQPDIVHCWLVSGNFWGRLAAVLAGAKHIIVAWRNCDLWKPVGARMLEWLTHGRAHHLANSKACVEFIAKKLWISASRFTVVYNGFESEKFNIPGRRKELFGHLNIPDDCKIVTMVGRLMVQKNYPMFIQVVRKAKDLGLPLYFIAAGGGPLCDNLIQMARTLDVQGRLSFIGVRNDIPQILASSDIFLFTTNYEGFPNALLEAMAAGLPVITTDFSGVRELVNSPDVGTVVSLNDVDAAVDAIRKYLDDAETTKLIGKNAQHFVQTNFAMPVMVEKTLLLYQEMLNR
jgi:glycosyltransferase involved in cell wall biosynthesis